MPANASVSAGLRLPSRATSALGRLGSASARAIGGVAGSAGAAWGAHRAPSRTAAEQVMSKVRTQYTLGLVCTAGAAATLSDPLTARTMRRCVRAAQTTNTRRAAQKLLGNRRHGP